MREKRVLAVVLAALSCAFFATACGGDKKPEEQHEYVYYKASDPTCTEKGKVERVCIKCGAKDYLEIEALGHIYKNGICTRCGAEENYVPAGDACGLFSAETKRLPARPCTITAKPCPLSPAITGITFPESPPCGREDELVIFALRRVKDDYLFAVRHKYSHLRHLERSDSEVERSRRSRIVFIIFTLR